MPRWYITVAIFKMKKYLFVLSALVLFAFCSCSKEAGNPVQQDFNIEGSYTELSVENGFVVTVDDAATQIKVKAGENVMPNVKVENVEGKLKIYLQPAITISGSNEMQVTLPYIADLTSVNLHGVSEFHSEYGLKGQKVEVNLSGASNFYCDIEADEIEMDLSGASTIQGDVDASQLDLEMSGDSDATLRGKVTTLEMNLSGGSSIEKTITGSNYGFECDFCNGSMSGGSVAYIHCNMTIKANLSGGSELHYTGAAITTDSSCTGGSNISHDAPQP